MHFSESSLYTIHIAVLNPGYAMQMTSVVEPVSNIVTTLNFTLNTGKGSQGSALLTVVIALVAGVVALAVIVSVLVMKMRRSKSTTKNLKEEIGIDHAPSGHQYVNEDEAVDGKEVREERL